MMVMMVMMVMIGADGVDGDGCDAGDDGDDCEEKVRDKGDLDDEGGVEYATHEELVAGDEYTELIDTSIIGHFTVTCDVIV